MPSFEPWDVVKVPFPYTDRPVRQWRPALVIAAGGLLETEHGLLWVLMITSAENRGWPSDVSVSVLPTSGLPAPSVIRCSKIATIEAREAERIGSLPKADQKKVTANLRQTLVAVNAAGPSHVSPHRP